MKELGKRRHKRVDIEQSIYVVASPKTAGVRCRVRNISEGGICVDVGDTPVPDMFGIAFKPGDAVNRICVQVWRQGSLIGARYESYAAKKAAKAEDQT